MKNVTLSIDEEVMRFAKVYAAKYGKSVSRLVADWLTGLMDEDRQRQQSLEDYLLDKPFLNTKGERVAREDIHDRKVFSRH